jgi:hypothetical protein
MNQNTITDLPNLRRENYENIFNVYTEDDGHYFYNLLQAVVIPSNLPRGYFYTYDVTYDDTWPYISYKNYNTPNLWWVILSVNNIIDPTTMPTPGTKIDILKVDVVKDILSQISTQGV